MPQVCRDEDVCEDDSPILGSELDPAHALARNGNLAFGALTIAHGYYWFRVALPVAAPELEEAPRLIAACIGAARDQAPRRMMVGPTSAFSHYGQ
jgi:hypothetical protein